MRTTASIDWFAGTSESPIFPAMFGRETTRGVPQRGYRSALQYVPDGRVQSINRVRDDMPDHVRYGGKTLTALAPIMTAHDIVRWHVGQTGHAAWHTTRIDLALDLYDSQLCIPELYREFQEGKVVTRAQKASIITNTDGGITLYVGSRQSEFFVRIYDKAKEAGTTTDWLRIEAEIKGARARAVATQCAETDDLSRFIVSMLSGYLMFDNEVYRRAMEEGKHAAVVPSQRKETDTRAWLMTQVVSAIVKVYQAGETGIVYDIMREVQRKLELTVEGDSKR